MAEFNERFPNRKIRREAFTVTSELYTAFTPLALNLTDLPQGEYEITISFIANAVDQNNFLFFKVTGDVLGVPEMSAGSNGKTLEFPTSYTFQLDITTGTFNIVLEMRKESAIASNIPVTVAGIYVRRVS